MTDNNRSIEEAREKAIESAIADLYPPFNLTRRIVHEAVVLVFDAGYNAGRAARWIPIHGESDLPKNSGRYLVMWLPVLRDLPSEATPGILDFVENRWRGDLSYGQHGVVLAWMSIPELTHIVCSECNHLTSDHDPNCKHCECVKQYPNG